MKPKLTSLEDRLAPSASLVKDINTAPAGLSSNPAQLTPVGNVMYFTAALTSTGTELWKTDGTSAGTVLVREINPGASAASLANLTAFNGKLLFSAYSPSSGYELWISDGTSSGTVLLKDIRPGTGSSYPSRFANAGGTLFFTANDGTNGNEIWATDGTPAGTRLVKDITPGSGGTPFGSSRSYAAMNGKLFFSANTAADGSELWVSDGTEAGTVMVKDITPGSGSSSPTELVAAGSRLFFKANGGGVNSVWKSDGTSTGTELVRTFAAGSFASTGGPPTHLELNGNYIFSTGTTGEAGIWASDGTSSGTVRFHGASVSSPGFAVPLYIANIAGKLFFSASSPAANTTQGSDLELWTSDGSPTGTTFVKDINPGVSVYGSWPARFVNISGKAYFWANKVGFGYELWESDGTSDGTQLVRDIVPGPGSATSAFPYPLSVMNNTIIFPAFSTNGQELWRSDGSSSGTVLVADINKPNAGAGMANGLNLNGTLYFTASGPEGNELWASDGTSTGTRLVHDINPGTGSSSPTKLTAVGNVVYFSAYQPATGRELWRTDGTSAGTYLVRDINPGIANSNMNDPIVAGGQLYFYPNLGDQQDLWVSDGTAAGTRQVYDFDGGTANPATQIEFDNKLYFHGTVYTYPAPNTVHVRYGFFHTQGTPATTVELPYDGYTQPGASLLSVMNNEMYSFGFTVSTGYALWKFQNQQWVLRHELLSGADDFFPRHLTAASNSIYFVQNLPDNRQAVWRSDGTSSGTMKLQDIGDPGISPGLANFTAVGNRLYFTANSAATGVELWTSDGTPAGTQLVKDIRPGSVGSIGLGTSLLVNYNGRLAFKANDGVSGNELWISDGTSAGTRRITEMLPGAQEASVAGLTAVGSQLFFSAFREDTGAELHRFVFSPPTVAAVAPPGVAATGMTVPLTLRFSDPAYLEGGNLLVTLNTGAVLSVPPFGDSEVTVNYTVAAGETTPQLKITGISLESGATLTDAIGNPAVLNAELAGTVIINPLPPTTVTFVNVNLGAPQRSRVRVIRLNFATPVNVDWFQTPGAIALTRSDGVTVRTGATGPNGRILLLPGGGVTSTLTIAFDNADGSNISAGIEHGSLADGLWQLSIPYLSYTSPPIRRFFGDANNDGTVDANDLASLGNAFGQTASNNPFDWNNDGVVQADDLAEFGNRFGRTL